MLTDERRHAVRELVGKTLAGVVVAQGGASPAAIVVLCFADGSTYELYSSAEISFTKSVRGPATPESLRDAVAAAWPGYAVEAITATP